jgi:hypothetical protein
MNNYKKAAYRHLLYVSMLAIRNYCQSRSRASINPLKWYRQYQHSIIAGALADWLHNLADFSVRDFDRFDEQRFWEEHTYLCRRFHQAKLYRYREIFDKYLAGEIYAC